MKRRTSLAVALLCGCAVPSAAQTPIPLREGLTIVTAVNEPRGDYESIKRIISVDDETVHVEYTGSASRQKAAPRKRIVRRADLQNAREYRQVFGTTDTAVYEGTTALGVSAAVLNDLRDKGETSLTFLSLRGRGLSGEHAKITGVLKLVEKTTMPVLVNNERVQLPALRARGKLGEEDAEFFFLDDPNNALTLRFRVGGITYPELEKIAKMIGREDIRLRENALDVVAIRFPHEPALERKLAESGHAEVYGIFFDFGSAAIKPESDPVVEEIASLLKRNAMWSLSIEGHTDNIGGDPQNLVLSRRRAAAVKEALIKKHQIAAERLSTTGYGASRPKEANDTIAGRARNRRVELVKR